jgi:hypothetical protein
MGVGGFALARIAVAELKVVLLARGPAIGFSSCGLSANAGRAAQSWIRGKAGEWSSG